ncbi:hypothetical protein ACT3OH_14845, partial [Vreelandella zhanjiangensis]|uniref:hypothetical protein n=1 Tax=Vreelandella zhanjiangensis TaxID=1121960 RepID=UPI00402A8457
MSNLYFISFNLIENDRLEEAKDIFLKRKNVFSNDEFKEKMLSFKKGYDLMTAGFYQDAVFFMEESSKLIGLIKDEEFEQILISFLSFCKGIVLLWEGDNFRAEEEITKAKEKLKGVILSTPSLEIDFFNMEAAVSTIKAKKALSIGNFNDFEKFSGEARGYYKRIINAMQLTGIENKKTLAVVYGSEIESCLAITRSFVDKFEFEKALSNLSKYKEDFHKLSQCKENIGDESLSRVLNVLCLIFMIYERLLICLVKFYVENKKIEVKDFTSLRSIEGLCMDARNEANLAGSRCQSFLYVIEQLERVSVSVRSLQSITKKDLGKASGGIALLVFVFLSLFIKFFVFKDEAYPSNFLLLQVVFSLIVGFGYGAIKFLPILKAAK